MVAASARRGLVMSGLGTVVAALFLVAGLLEKAPMILAAAVCG